MAKNIDTDWVVVGIGVVAGAALGTAVSALVAAPATPVSPDGSRHIQAGAGTWLCAIAGGYLGWRATK